MRSFLDFISEQKKKIKEDAIVAGTPADGALAAKGATANDFAVLNKSMKAPGAPLTSKKVLGQPKKDAGFLSKDDFIIPKRLGGVNKRYDLSATSDYSYNGTTIASESIQGLEAYTPAIIMDLCLQYVSYVAAEQCYDIVPDNIAIIGSRNTWTGGIDSDLDVLLHYSGDATETEIYNLLNNEVDGNVLYIEDVRVDFIPIRDSESGTFDSCLSAQREHDKEILKKNKTL